MQKLARDSAWAFGGQVVRIAAQAAYFILLARTLGVTQFGVLAAVLAIVAIAVPFAGWGGGNIMIMRTARDRSAFRTAFGASLLMVVWSGSALTVVTTAISVAVIGELALAVQVALSDLVLARLADTCSQAYQGLGRLRASACLGTVPYVVRLLAAVAFVQAGGSGASGWGPWYLGSAAVSATIAGAVAIGRLGRPRFSSKIARGQLKEGFLFAVGASSATVYNDIDKAMVARLASLGAAGVYAAASRAVGMAFAPILAVYTAAYYRFFAAGAGGIAGTIELARKLAPAVLGLGIAATLGLWFAAPLAPHILGPGYGDAVEGLRWLSIVPLLQAVFYLAGDVLTGAGFQGLRSAAQVGAAGLNVSLNLWLIPLYSWRGAAAATVVTDATLALALWAIIAGKSRRRGGLAAPVTA
jgi:O-antigen/teichoic acid export membrane protein